MQRIPRIVILFLLLHQSCSFCNKQINLDKEGPWGAIIAIAEKDGVKPMGTINGYPVLQLTGNIERCEPEKHTVVLCACFVRDGDSLDGVAEEIRKQPIQQGEKASGDVVVLNTLYQLSKGSFVNYERLLDPGETGQVKFSISSLDPQKVLEPGTAYKVYLGIKFGSSHFFYNSDCFCTYSTPSLADYPRVTMASAKCQYSHNHDGSIIPKLSMEARVTQLNAPFDAGFMLIKQGKGLTPSGVLEKQLEKASPFPTTPNKFIAHADGVVIHPCGSINSNATFSISDQDDPDAVLEKGATYAVFGYLQKDDYYYVSQESLEITLPKVEVKVTMETSTPQLGVICDGADRNVRIFELAVEGKIEVAKNTTDPMAGFLVVPADARELDNEAARKEAIRLITDATKAYPSSTPPPFYSKQTTSGQDYWVCITHTTGVDTPQSLESTLKFAKDDKTSLLDLKNDYYVYFWVQDANGKGEVFLSETGAKLELLYVEGKVTNVGVDRSATGEKVKSSFPLEFHVDTPNHRNSNNVALEALFIKGEDDAVDETLLEEILQSRIPVNKWSPIEEKGTGKKSSLSWGLAPGTLLINKQKFNFPAIEDGKVGLNPGPYTVYFVVAKGKMAYVLGKKVFKGFNCVPAS